MTMKLQVQCFSDLSQPGAPVFIILIPPVWDGTAMIAYFIICVKDYGTVEDSEARVSLFI